MNEALKKSLLFHFLFIGPVVFTLVSQNKINRSGLNKIEFQVIEKTIPKDKKIIKIEEQEVNAVKQQNQKQKEVSKEPAKKVFGLQKNTLLNDSSSEGVAIKKGNTVLKEQDNEIAENDDPLPVPKPEYMVTQMPVLLEEVIPQYPQEAKNNNFETSVAINILIDEKGIVRSAVLIEDPGMGLGKAALDAVKQYKFKPAKIADKTVAVEIRYYVEFKINA
ncbi:MAG TPA: TonB family protein [Oligoflexia bacterium]|nr:TonB family protein [Oligoflexia bacterium]HMR24034.1 TonB family protein [Oligoflexia bacterium]